MKSDWRPFAEKLTDLAKAEGQKDFLSIAFEFLNDFVTVDNCAVFKVAADKSSGAEHLCTFGNLKPDLAELLAKDYVNMGFKNDPMVQTALLSPNVKVRHIPGSQYSPAYQSQYFAKANLIDKITSIHTSHNIIFLVSFYRVKGNGIFAPADFKDLKRLAPIIGRFVLRHAELTPKKDVAGHNIHQRIRSLVNDNTQVFAKLSFQEREVCQSILQGVDEANIAHSMGLSKHTIITYRRRIYAKLDLSSKSELYKLALLAL